MASQPFPERATIKSMEQGATMRGMTWNHSRGYDPLVAASIEWKALTGETIEWDQRSLQDFESYPVEELAQRHGAGVDTETPNPREAYAKFSPSRREPLDEAGLPWQ